MPIRFKNIRISYEQLKNACWKARYMANPMSKRDAEQALINLEKIELDLL